MAESDDNVVHLELEIIRDELAQGATAPPAHPLEPASPKVPQSGLAGGFVSTDGGLPDGCPVKPLGVHGDSYFYLDAQAQIRELKAGKHGRLEILALFGTRTKLLHSAFPRHKRDGTVDGWRAEQAAEALMVECARRGIWDPAQRLRGPGAWMGENGELILHCGHAVWIGPVPEKPEGQE